MKNASPPKYSPPMYAYSNQVNLKGTFTLTNVVCYVCL